jgi:hypothetical protein
LVPKKALDKDAYQANQAILGMSIRHVLTANNATRYEEIDVLRIEDGILIFLAIAVNSID